MSSSIEDALGNLTELCGIYEWRAKGTRPNQPNYVVYVGSTCVRRKPQKLGGRIIRYCKYGNHKEDLINEALARGYELWVRVKPASSEREAQGLENALLRDYDYAWNKRQNGGDDGLRLDILPWDSEDTENSEDSSDSEDDDDDDNAEETYIWN